ncbi:MAG: helix-turn-helix domain-containing protein [Bryobacteraceae bacterium]
MTQWAKPHDWIDGEVDLDLVEESALAAAQSTIQNAVSKTGISRAEMARRMGRDRSFVSRILNGSHNLTIKTMARSLAVCGFEVRFQPVALEWNWAAPHCPVEEEFESANADSSVLKLMLNTVEPALSEIMGA